jgi:hypothetical protein
VNFGEGEVARSPRKVHAMRKWPGSETSEPLLVLCFWLRVTLLW